MPGMGAGSHASGRKTMAAASLKRRGGGGGGQDDGVSSTITYGRTAGYDAGTAGDVFVDKVNGSNANNGLTAATAKQTIAAAWALIQTMTGTRTMRIMGDGVRYYESISGTVLGTLSQVAFKSYGTDKPWLSGAAVLGGFTQCTSGDEAILGPNYASIYKATIPTASIAHTEYWRCMVAENGELLKLAVLRKDDTIDPLFIDSTMAMYADAVEPTLTMTVNPTYFNTITHSAVLGAFTDAQLAQTVAATHAYPNVASFVKVASVASQVLTLATNTARPNSAGTGAYALFNVAAAIEQGGWAYRDDGSGTLTVYVWPNDVASLPSGIEIAARKSGIKIGGGSTASIGAVTVEGIGLEMFTTASTDFSDGPLFANGAGTWTVKQVHLDRCTGQHLIFFKFASNVTLEHVTLQRGAAAYGIGTADSGGAGIYNHRWSNVLAMDLSQTGYRMFGLRDSVVRDLKAVRTSAGGHANTINLYAGCDNVAVIRFIGGYLPGERLYAGYGTNNASSRLYFLHCVFPMGPDTRAFVDQSNAGAVHPVNPSENYLVNCWVPHEPARLTGGFGGGQVVLGENTPTMNWHVYNSLVTKLASSGGTLTRKNNILTDPATSPGDPSESVVADIDTLHRDAAVSDFRAVNGGLLRSAAGMNVETLVAGWEALFPGINLRQDIRGRVWDPADPGVGPFGKSW